jgi:deoxyribonucleoside regulator
MQKNRDYLIDIARKYYMEGLSQQEIAREFGISRPTVSNLLKQCREEGIVTIQIEDYSSSLTQALADQLKTVCPLREVVVVQSQMNQEMTLSTAGEAAADLLLKRLRDGITLGLSWGTSLYQFVRQVPRRPVVDAEVIQMVGSLGAENPESDGFELVRNLAHKLNSGYSLLHAPILVKTPELKKMLEQEQRLEAVLEKMASIDIAFVGISSDCPEDSSLVREGFLSAAEAQKIVEAGGVGHICCYHYDRDGRFLDVEENRRIIGVRSFELTDIPEVVGVACGSRKAEAILGSLRGGLIDTLITDEAAALSMLSSLKQGG